MSASLMEWKNKLHFYYGVNVKCLFLHLYFQENGEALFLFENNQLLMSVDFPMPYSVVSWKRPSTFANDI